MFGKQYFLISHFVIFRSCSDEVRIVIKSNNHKFSSFELNKDILYYFLYSFQFCIVCRCILELSNLLSFLLFSYPVPLIKVLSKPDQECIFVSIICIINSSITVEDEKPLRQPDSYVLLVSHPPSTLTFFCSWRSQQRGLANTNCYNFSLIYLLLKIHLNIPCAHMFVLSKSMSNFH